MSDPVKLPKYESQIKPPQPWEVASVYVRWKAGQELDDRELWILRNYIKR